MEKRYIHMINPVNTSKELGKMFAKKELSDAEIEQIKLKLDISMRNAAESRSRFLDERVNKLKAHSQKVEHIRNRHNAPFVESTCLSEVSIGFIKQMQEIKDVEQFQVFMLSKETLQQAEAVVHYIERYKSQLSLPCCEIQNRPKIFMSTVLLARFSSEIMPSPSVEEQELIKNCREFLGLLSEHNAANDMKSLAWKWSSTAVTFSQWSSKDRFTLRTKMKQDFLRWQQKIGNWQRDHHSHAEWEPHVLEYQVQIINKIYQVFGHAEIESLKKDVAELNKTFIEADLVIEFDQGGGEYKCYWKDRPKSTFQPSKENLHLLKETRKKIKNIQILHELMLKEDSVNFEKILNMAGSATLEEITKKNIQTITTLTAMLKQVQEPERIVNVLVDIFEYMRGALIELAGDNPDYRREIQLIDCSISPCDWVRESAAFLQSIMHYCKKCCAPVRDPQCALIDATIAALSHESDNDGIATAIMGSITHILELLNDMRSDFSNFRLKMLAIQLDGKGIAEKYELDHLIEATGNNFTKTEEWLRQHAHDTDTPLETLARAYLRLFDPLQVQVDERSLPETFTLDIDRIQRYRQTLERDLVASTICLFLKNQLKTEPEQLAILSEKINSSALEITEILPIIESATAGADACDVLRGTIRRLLQSPGEDKVFTLLKHRKFSQIRSKMILKKESQLGTTSIEDKIASLFRYNKACFSEIYDKILQK